VSSDSGDRKISGPFYASDSSTSPYRAMPQHRSPVYGGGHGRRGRRRRGPVIALIAGAGAVVIAVAVAIVIVVLPGGTTYPTGLVPNGSSPAQDAQQITTAFLTAWDAGNLSQAAKYTNSPAAAQAGLTTYRKYLNLKKLTSSAGAVTAAPGAGTRESVTFALSARVSATFGAKTLAGTWSYHSSLVTYQQPNEPVWYIDWVPDVVAPNLTATTRLAAISVGPQVVAVDDDSGNQLSSYNDAGLDTISSDLQQKGPAGQGTPGLYVEIQTDKGKAVPNSQAVVIPPNNIADLSTTITPSAESAARSAVAQHANSSMVAIQPSTGKILAVANNDGYNDFALTAAVAPGSTMKIITSTALINGGLATASSGVACPPTVTVQGITYHNDNNESEPAGTPLTTDFAESCNNAFDQWWPHLYGKLASTAEEYYGLNQKWDIGIAGVSFSYFNAPPTASGSELAQEAFGEGALQASPIAMASVAATVDTGTFKQPYLVAGTKQVTGTPLPANTDAQLKTMMRAVVQYGTAAGDGFGPDVYAKTGTADIVGQGQPNSWLVAFDPDMDIAVACLVVDAGYGAQVAGPEVETFLSKY
jgi:hypothetical protein